MLQPIKHLRRGKRFWTQGEPLIWATGGALAFIMLATFLLLGVVLFNGLGTFWPSRVMLVELNDGTKVLGQRLRETENSDDKVRSVQFKTGNREIDADRQDFHWYKTASIRQTTYPSGVFVLERQENGNFFGYLKAVKEPNGGQPDGTSASATRLGESLRAVAARQTAEIAPLADRISEWTYQIETIGGKVKKIEYHRKRLLAAGAVATQLTAVDAELKTLCAEEAEAKRQSDLLQAQMQQRRRAIAESQAVFVDAAGKEVTIPLTEIVRFYQPNDMSLPAKLWHYAGKIRELLFDQPRESNTEGGLFPAIFGTVMLVFLMAIVCFPLGVLAGVYLGEYAKEGFLVRMVRIGVNNLSGIPSIVYGIFGLGFFIYGIGKSIDAWLFPEMGQVFSTGGILWASLTLGLLTIPVVIVATEESLRTIPRSIREGSYALGATKFQTLVRVLLPIASPGIMTGFILAMARAAGEVAPLMITGVIKSAPDMPLDGRFPFFHVERKFMHLGFHIYDIGFQSPNAEACKPMVYVTTLLLLLIVLSMSSVAIYLRNRMRKHYQSRSM